jgi:agmatinase
VAINSEITYPGFLDLPERLTNFEFAKVVILCLPYEASTTYGKGTEKGPEAIVKASHHVETYDEELKSEPCEVGINTQMPIKTFDRVPEKAVNQITQACEILLSKNKFVVGLGGEHTVTVGLVQAFKKYFPDMWVLQLDAHSDLRDSYRDSQYNHACVMARIGELCPFVGVGIRSSIQDELDYLRPPSNLVYAYQMNENKAWPELVLSQLGNPVYITIDLDFFDPAVLPSVGTPEPGGFFWYETIRFLRKVIQSRRVIGLDVVELCPKSDVMAPDFFAAKLIYKLIGYVFEDKLSSSANKNLDY